MKLPFFLARRFVAAETVEETLPVAQRLHNSRLGTTLDRLGEYVDDPELARTARDSYINLVETIAGSNGSVDRNISVKMSMLGQNIDESFCLDNLHMLLEKAHEHETFVRLDMEGSDTTGSTISIFERVHADYPDNVGIVLQAYLKRTREDVAQMCEMNARVRLCKGAYREPPSIAHQDMSIIRERFAEHMEMLISGGNYPGIATHDDTLIEATKAYVRKHAVPASRFEFQMLYGIRPSTQLEIVDQGYNMRIYVPFGTSWMPYFSRRLRERKENVFFVLKNLFRR